MKLVRDAHALGLKVGEWPAFLDFDGRTWRWVKTLKDAGVVYGVLYAPARGDFGMGVVSGAHDELVVLLPDADAEVVLHDCNEIVVSAPSYLGS